MAVKDDLVAVVADALQRHRVPGDPVADQVLLAAGRDADRRTDTGDGDDALARYVDGMVDLPQLTPLGTSAPLGTSVSRWPAASSKWSPASQSNAPWPTWCCARSVWSARTTSRKT